MTPPSRTRSVRQPKASGLPEAVAAAASLFLFHRRASRPVQTLAWAAAAGLAAAPSRPAAEPGLVHLEMNQDVWLDALFNDWNVTGEPWPKAEAKAGLAVLQQVVMSQRVILPPLPAFPARPSLTQPVLDKLWHHLDLAGWRALRFTTDPLVEPHLAPERPVGRLIHEGVNLLEQFHMMMLKAYTDNAASARDYTEELAGLLHHLHGTLDQAARVAGVDPLGWPIPDYTPFMGEPYPLPPGPRGATLPEALAQDLQRALTARRCPRPLPTALPLVQWYGALKQALDPGWTWSPARDGRECAFILFESSLEDLPEWSPSQARELARLCTALHGWSVDQPLPPLPALELDPTDGSAASLWRHQDQLFLIGSVLGVDLGILGQPEARGGTTKTQRRLREQWSEVQSLLWGALTHWGEASPEHRDLLAEALPLSLGAIYQAFRNEIAKVERPFLRFVPKPPEHLLPRAKNPMVRFGRVKKR